MNMLTIIITHTQYIHASKSQVNSPSDYIKTAHTVLVILKMYGHFSDRPDILSTYIYLQNNILCCD